MAFSSGVKLGDLDDFISLSQECVKPLIEAAEGSGKSAKLGNVSEARSLPVAEVPQVKKPNLIKSKQSGSDPKAQIGQVTLSDCLACSGCVTSAETVLLQEQSGDEFLKRAETSPLTVVSISAEARTSIAAHNGEGPLLTLRRIGEGLRRLGADLVLEASAAEAVALLEGQAEFTQRFRSAADFPLPRLDAVCREGRRSGGIAAPDANTTTAARAGAPGEDRSPGSREPSALLPLVAGTEPLLRCRLLDPVTSEGRRASGPAEALRCTCDASLGLLDIDSKTG